MKIYITDCDHDSIDIERKVFHDAGMNVTLCQAKSEEEVIRECGDGEILIVQYAHISEKVMEAMPQLKYIVRYGVGLDTIDIPAATRHGVLVGNVPDYGMNEVADQAISMALAFERKIIEMNRYTKEQKWDYTHAIPIHRFSNSTVGVVGIGRIGKNFAKKMHALGFRVIGSDPLIKQTPELKEYIDIVSFDQLVEESDIISVHCPVDGNKNLIDKKVLQKMKPTALLINVARGGIINEEDLEDALNNHEIGGAALDCMMNEPVGKDSPLFKHDNVIVSPHIAWYSEESAMELKRKVAEESVRFSKGEKIHYPTNKVQA